MIKVGQIYRQKEEVIPEYRKHEARVFVITHINMTNISAIDTNGCLQHIGQRWVEGDCEFIAEYPTWQEAIASCEFIAEYPTWQEAIASKDYQE